MPKLALLDLYAGKANQGMRCLRKLAADHGLEVTEFEVRQRAELPSVEDFDVFISSGGPGDPHEVVQSEWGSAWGAWLEALTDSGKPGFLICHSFQMACIHWDLAEVTLRARPAFGIYPGSHTEAGFRDPVFGQLDEPFWMIDSRDWQVIQADAMAMQRRGARILAIEKERPHVPLERATLAVRFSERVLGTQFHPEGDEQSMIAYIENSETRAKMVETHGEEKIDKILRHIGDPNKVSRTQRTVLPTFFRQALRITA